MVNPLDLHGIVDCQIEHIIVFQEYARLEVFLSQNTVSVHLEVCHGLGLPAGHLCHLTSSYVDGNLSYQTAVGHLE